MLAPELLKTLVSIPSVNPFRIYADTIPVVGLGAEEKIGGFIEAFLSSRGIEVTRQLLHPALRVSSGGNETEIPARWNLLATKRPGGRWNGKSILFFGHTDTVDVKQGWETNPFEIHPRIVDGRERWYGLGANDMKGGLAALLEALTTAESSETMIKAAFVVDEEFYSLGAEALCNSEFVADVELALAPEIGDAGYAAFTQSPDLLWVGVGRLGRVEYEVQVEGKACHGADVFVRKDAVNAVVEAARLEVAFADDCNRIYREYSSDGITAMNSAFISFHAGGEPMLSVPDRATFVLDRTLLPDESPDAELERLRRLIAALQANGTVNPAAKISIRQRHRPTPACRPYYFSPSTPAIKKAADIAALHASHISFGIGRSVADENRVAALGIPTITLGPTGFGSHTSQEWVDLASVNRIAKIYRDIIRNA